jgi:hypothetical protein
MLSTLASLADFGLRLTRTVSTVTLGFSRLARRSIFILVCSLADPLKRTFSIAGLDAGIAPFAPTTAFRLERKLPGGLSSSHWNQAPFHGAPEFFALPIRKKRLEFTELGQGLTGVDQLSCEL